MQVSLVMFRESGERRDFPIEADAITIGRKDDCDVRIPLVEVSRHHAQVVIADQNVVLKDLGSANGTYLNNKRIKKEASLKPGDHVVVGPVVFTVQIDGEPSNLRAVKTKLRPLSAVADAKGGSGELSTDHVYQRDESIDPISALEALASSAEQTAIDPFDDEDALS